MIYCKKSTLNCPVRVYDQSTFDFKFVQKSRLDKFKKINSFKDDRIR